MIKFENVEVVGWEAAIRGMRNPMNSWSKADSTFEQECVIDVLNEGGEPDIQNVLVPCLDIGPNDLTLMTRLRESGTDHRKFMRMITVYVDITAPLYLWKEFDTYKVGTVANSCSTMHKIADKEFTLEDFSCEHLIGPDSGNRMTCEMVNDEVVLNFCSPKECLQLTINMLNFYRQAYLADKSKENWWQMIQLLPSSYNQRRTIMLNYEVLANIYKSRKNHKLDEWALHTDDEQLYIRQSFCDWIKTLPYSELITGEFNN